MSEELKPCPFCGGADIAISVDENQGNKWGSAVCFSCSAVGPEVRTGYETYPEASWRAEAAAEWNRRASPTPEAELEMKKAFVDAASHLMAAASAYRKYAKGDPLFTTRAEDYDRAVVRARSALSPPAKDMRK